VRDATRFSRRHLPEALPANYAWSGNLKRDGDQAFIALFHDLVNGCSISMQLHEGPAPLAASIPQAHTRAHAHHFSLRQTR